MGNQKKSQRTRYTKEFKEDVCRLILEEGRTRADVARSLGVNPASVTNWVKDYQANKQIAFPGNGNQKLTDEQRRIKELEKELRDTRMERDILKKAIAFVANPQD